ncbi:hypothetical protein B0O80DRAFT_499794 [Mortierella sp. GBAus27b]|nr:hypothetical protein BGX31_003276 [Mortierella sp. GBA43]KAI8351878.1 hypothetical protein B0O80DRAFT_499794 [Mortierella sp. GBAus27b]
MSTVAKRLDEAHEPLLKLYTSIPILTPCLEQIKTKQAEFVATNNRLRQLQEDIAAVQQKTDKSRKQLDSVFTINRAETEKTYHLEVGELKALEDERRACLRRRDNIVTERYQVQKEHDTLLEETRKLKRLTESIFDRSKDETANTDFPEELYWQLELRDHELKITEVKHEVAKYTTALTNLSRAATLSEAALMALLGYPDAAYQVWQFEYALQTGQKMRLYMRVELSLNNAYSNEASAREACPNLLPPFATPIKPNTVQPYFERTVQYGKVQPFKSEGPLRHYIARLRSAHKSAEIRLVQAKERLSAIQAYRESIIPLLANIRRRVFQDSCLGGRRIEGWEDEQGQSLLGTEADILVRGGIHEIGFPTINMPSTVGSSSQASTQQRRTTDTPEWTNDQRKNSNSTPDTRHQEIPADRSRPVMVDNGRMVVSASRVPFSMLEPSNVLGSEVLVQVDRAREAKLAKEGRSWIHRYTRSQSHSRQDEKSVSRPHSGKQEMTSESAVRSPNTSSSSHNGDTVDARQREERDKTPSRFFGFASGRRASSSGEDAAATATTAPTSPMFQMEGRGVRSSVDVSSSSPSNTGVTSHSSASSHDRNVRQGHQRGVPSISVSSHDDTLGRSRVMSMDEYVGIGPIAERSDTTVGAFDPSQNPAPLVPSYEEHQHHKVIDPDLVHMMASVSYDDQPPRVEEGDGLGYRAQDATATDRSWAGPMSPQPYPLNQRSVDGDVSSSAIRPRYQQDHDYSVSDQRGEGRTLGEGVPPPPNYGTMPPNYSA